MGNNLVPMRAEITATEFENIEGRPEMIYQMARRKAEELGYHPAGYGLYNHRAVEEGFKYYVIWDRWHSCD